MFFRKANCLCSRLLLAASVLAASACHKAGPQSTIRMSDLHTQTQLLRGFYDLEAGAWRWTGKDFSVSLKTPPDASSKGATLVLQGTLVPECVQNGPLQIDASVSGESLPPQQFSKPGQVIYRVDVPPSALKQSIVAATFNLNNAHRVPGDVRELGMIASVISLRQK